MRHFPALTLIALLAAPLAASAQEAMAGPHHAGATTARIVDAEGRALGQLRLVETPFHGVLITGELEGLAPGPHAFHIHETGRCEAPSFQSAGGHYAPRGHAHGVLVAEGKHAGDLLNLHVPADGRVRVERLARDVTLRPHAPHGLLDHDGSAVVIHAGADDYESQPSGAAGSRVGCGVIGG